MAKLAIFNIAIIAGDKNQSSQHGGVVLHFNDAAFAVSVKIADK